MSQQNFRSRVACSGLATWFGCGFAFACACAEADSCPAIAARTVEPAAVETSAELLASTPGIVQLVVSSSGLYWHDGTSISALLPGQAGASALYALPHETAAEAAPFGGEQRAITGLLADADHLYWSEASVSTGGFVLGYSPPGRLLSMPKAGGPVQLLLDLSDRALSAVAVDDARVIVQISGVAAGYHSFSKLDQTLAPLLTPAVYETSRVVGDEIYWTEQQEENPRLFRARIDATEGESIARIESGEYDVGPGYVLWRHDRVLTEPELLLQQNFVIWRADSGCVQSLPGSGESISYATAPDRRYVYWHSFNALGSVSLSSEGVATPLPEMPLQRLDLNNGRLERLEASGFHFIPGDQILGLDGDRLFVATAAGLLAIRTP